MSPIYARSISCLYKIDRNSLTSAHKYGRDRATRLTTTTIVSPIINMTNGVGMHKSLPSLHGRVKICGLLNRRLDAYLRLKNGILHVCHDCFTPAFRKEIVQGCHVTDTRSDNNISPSNANRSSNCITARMDNSSSSHCVELLFSNGNLRFECSSAIEKKTWLNALQANSQWHIFDFYCITNMMRKGKRARVYTAYHRLSGEKVALKINAQTNVFKSNETQILLAANYPNVMNAFEVLHGVTWLYIVMPHMDCTLFDWMRKLVPVSEEKAKIVMHQLLSGLSYLHSRGIVHGNLTHLNVLVSYKSGFNLKIANFRRSLLISGARPLKKEDNYIGAPLYMAPELVQYGTVDFGVDVWSAGVMMYEILTGFAFMKGSPSSYTVAQSRARYLFDKNKKEVTHLSEDSRSLLSILLCKNARERCSAAEALNHQWFS